MENKVSTAAFLKFYDEICSKADAIFRESNICQWEKNSDGTISCITNRQNSKNRPLEFRETDGCCIELCKNPREFSDTVIKKKQHNPKKGCLVKSLKCKLHICDLLVKMSEKNADIKRHITELEELQKMFTDRYKKLWLDIPYAASKAVYVKRFKRLNLARDFP